MRWWCTWAAVVAAAAAMADAAATTACLHQRRLAGTGLHRSLVTELHVSWHDGAPRLACDVAVLELLPCDVAVLELLPGDIFVDPHQLRDAEAWSGVPVRVGSGPVDLEGPASTGHTTVVVALAQSVVAQPDDDATTDGLAAAFEFPVHLRYARPTAPGVASVIAIQPPQQVLVRCGTAHSDGTLDEDARDALAGARLPVTGWQGALYTGLCDQRNATDGIVVRDVVAGHADAADEVTWITLLVTVAGAAAVIAASLTGCRSPTAAAAAASM